VTRREACLWGCVSLASLVATALAGAPLLVLLEVAVVYSVVFGRLGA